MCCCVLFSAWFICTRFAIGDWRSAQSFAQRIAGDGFQTPIDEIDAAARILDPVMVGLNHDELHYGVFFKDYRLTEW